jgi:hypothetical protein
MVGHRSIALRGSSMRRGLMPGAWTISGTWVRLFHSSNRVAVHLVLAERLAVVRGDDDHRALPPRLRVDVVEDLLDVHVDEVELAVVHVLGALAEALALGVAQY